MRIPPGAGNGFVKFAVIAYLTQSLLWEAVSGADVTFASWAGARVALAFLLAAFYAECRASEKLRGIIRARLPGPVIRDEGPPPG